MLKLEGCAKCKKGDVAIDKDQYGWYEYCLQCGYMRDLVDMDEPEWQQASGVRERRERVSISGEGE